VPWSLQRFQESGQSRFITFSRYHRRPLFTTTTSKATFETALERVRGSFGLRIYGYVVMPEHVHLVTGEPQCKTLADALKSLK
jgi:putative transposase